MKHPLRAIALATLITLVSMHQGNAADYYGAIAYSPGSGAHGYSFDYSSRGKAERVAMRGCRKYASDCQIAVWFRNGCGALVVGPNGYGYSFASTRKGAVKRARRKCRQYGGGCRTLRWVCTAR